MKKPCRRSGKTKYDTHEHAAIAAGKRITASNESFSSRKWSRPEALWTYLCEFCNHWHLTSKDPTK